MSSILKVDQIQNTDGQSALVIASDGSVDSVKYAEESNPSGRTITSTTMSSYEEGTWIPTVQGTTTAGTSTYTSIREATYVKIGSQVTITCNLVLTTFSGAVGNAVVTGIPFSASPNFGVATGTFECDQLPFSSGYTSAYVIVFGGQSQVSYRQQGSNVDELPINVTQINANNRHRWSVTYFTDE